MPEHADPMPEIARRIHAARHAAGLSQHELAQHAGVSRPSVARIEAGEDVSTATLLKVTRALGLAVEITDNLPSAEDV